MRPQPPEIVDKGREPAPVVAHDPREPALLDRLDRVVAVKMLHPWVATDEDARRRFRREATTLAQLRHPNVVQVLDFDDALPAPFLVQEHCGGGTLVRRSGA